MSFKKPDLFFIFHFLKSFSFSISSKEICGLGSGPEKKCADRSLSRSWQNSSAAWCLPPRLQLDRPAFDDSTAQL